MTRFLSWVLLLLLLAVGATVLTLGRMPPKRPEVGTSLAVSQVLGGPADSSFARALEARSFQFPRDHGPHPEFRTEWWYLTGNLEGPGGAPYGFQFTLFRSALPTGVEDPSGSPSEDDSYWRARQIYMGHLAVTDVHGGDFHAFERFSRGAAGLAGSQADPFRVWLEDWELETSHEGIRAFFPLRLRAAEGGVGLSLQLDALKPLVLQGEEGLSQKGPEPGNASYYYSFTRMEARGDLVLDGDTVPVSGLAWMDREWSTSALSPGQVGWDWFALHLGDGSDLMYYQLRMEDGSADSLSRGILVDREGSGRALSSGEVQIDVLGRWVSPVDETSYPSGWRISVPDEGLELSVTPYLEAQELRLTFRYWEGAVRVTGTRQGREVEGMGYVELTGYSGPTPGSEANLQRR